MGGALPGGDGGQRRSAAAGAAPRLTPPAPDAIERALVAVQRDERSRLLATLVRLADRDIDAAEDALAEAMAAALDAWRTSGLPAAPGAWLLTAARRRLLDAARRRRRRPDEPLPDDDRLPDVASTAALPELDAVPDDELRLIFTCCHPTLALPARVALTLRTVGGLTTPEIARAFLEPEATTAQRIVRAKQKIRDAGIPYRIPEPHDLPGRLDGVLEVLYLIFNEGYGATGGHEFIRRDLCEEAIRLAAQTARLLPHEPEPLGLLALMQFHHARRDGRVAPDGTIVPLEEQPRDRWDRTAIAEAHVALTRAMQMRRPGPYQLQAAIAGLHAQAPAPQATDWPQIVQLYQALLNLQPTPVVEFNHAVAIGMAKGPAWGLALLEPLAVTLDEYYLYHAARADLLRREGRAAEAAVAYQRALALVTHSAERRYLERRLAELSSLTADTERGA